MVPLFRLLAALDQDNYPEHLGEMFVINCPTVFSIIWSLVKPMLDERTKWVASIGGMRACPARRWRVPTLPLSLPPPLSHSRRKIHVLTASKLDSMFQVINPRSLPAFLGGKCECPGQAASKRHRWLW